MSIKNQFDKIKENWLLLVIVLVIMGFFTLSSGFGGVSLSSMGKVAMAEYEVAQSESFRAGGYMPTPSGDFAPEVEERVITKTASLSTEVEKGEFEQAESKLKSIVKTSDGFLLNENINKYETGRKSYYTGYYSIKVDTKKYDAVIAQLKEIGEVKSFNENALDITGRYTDTQTNLGAEKERLVRYGEMYEEAERVEDKITLSDRIFNQERTIKYLEQALENMDKRVDYSTVSVSITEKRSEYADIIFVKFAYLVKGFVMSINSLLKIIVWAIPYAIGLWLVVWIVKRFRKK